MRTLAIETATEACSIALFDGTELLAHDHRVMGRGHAERLVPMIAGLPDKGRAERIIVSLGPGSFTGVRIGIATARALGIAWGSEVLGYPTLSLVAAMAISDTGSCAVTVCMNGGHGEWFIQGFEPDQEPAPAQSLSPEQAQSLEHHRIIAGNRAQELSALLSCSDHIAIELLPDAGKAGLLDGSTLSANLTPVYGRGPDAKLPAL